MRQIALGTTLGLGICVAAAAAVLQTAPPASQPVAVLSATASYLADGKQALAAARYKEARDTFLAAATAHPSDYEPLHGAGIACLYLHDDQQAAKLLEQAMVLAPTPDRALSYNFAVADMNLHNYRRAAQTLRDYLYANPRTVDEPLFDALGSALFQTGDNNAASRASNDVRKFFSVYAMTLEAKRPGMKKWGSIWAPSAEVDAKAKAMQDAEAALALVSRDLQNEKSSVDDYRQQLQAARQGHGIRSAKDASRSLNDEQKKLDEVQRRYDAAIVKIDNVRPQYPQLLLPIAMDDLSSPPIAPPAAMATATPISVTPALSTPTAAVNDVIPSAASVAAEPTPIPTAMVTPRPAAVPAPPAAEAVPTACFAGDQLRQCHVEPDGAIVANGGAKLELQGTMGQDFVVSGELFLSGQGENGGVAFYLREADGMHRYELTSGGLRAKRVMLEGKMLSKFAYPISFNDVPQNQWVPFRIEAKTSTITMKLGNQSGVAKGPLSNAGMNSVELSGGAKLRNVKVDVVHG